METDLIELRNGPLSLDDALRAVIDPTAGGLDFFVGTTRAENHPDLGALIALEYHAYDPMALAELRRIAVTARAKFPIHRLVIFHRLGRVNVSAASVIVGVSTGHRAEAFDACRFLIDQLKASVPIWKHEHYQRGTKWQHPE